MNTIYHYVKNKQEEEIGLMLIYLKFKIIQKYNSYIKNIEMINLYYLKI